jgi:hypothetical protein
MAERVATGLVHDRERLWSLGLGGSVSRPIEVASAAGIEAKARVTPCPQCGARLDLIEHIAQDGAMRRFDVRCVQCGVPRRVWFRIVSSAN